MRFRTCSIFCVTALLIVGAAQSASVIPQVVLGGGYEFVIILSNKARTPRTFEFRLLEGDDRPWSTPFTVNGAPHIGNIVRVTLGGHCVEKIRLGGDALRVGYLWYPEDFWYGSFVATVTTQFFYEFRRDGDLIDSIEARRGRATWGSNGLAFPVERSLNLNTGLALAPWSPPGGAGNAFAYTLRLFDEEGDQVGLETLTFRGHTALFIDEVFPDLPLEFLGWLSVEVPGGMSSMNHLYVTVLRQELTSNGFQLTGVEPDFGIRAQLP